MTVYRKLTLFCVCMASGAWAQTFTIPDPAFAAKLEQLVPNAITGNVLSTMHPDVLALTQMSVGSANITDLSGVEHFTALEALACPNNQLTSLPELPSTLTVLVCSNNLLTELPELWPNLVDLQCRQNLLTSLPELPSGLLQLVCSNNQLTTLPPLPADLYFLDCSFNQITALPTLPDELEWIYCQNNQLTTLLHVPDSAVMLRCDNNLLSTLPSMANSALHILMCWSNQLTELPELPPTLGQFWCHTNPLKCFPWLPNSLYNLNCTNTPTTCLPNIPASLDSTSFWAPFPLQVCDVTASDCAIREETISGTVFNDLNGDGLLDPGEPPFLLAQVEAQPGNFITAPDPNGHYVLHVDVGTYVLNGQPVLYHERTTGPVSTTLGQYDSDTLRHIGYQIIPGMYDVVADLVGGVAQPGFINSVNLGVQNVGTETTQATITFLHSPVQEWNNSDLAPETLVGNVATWSATLAPGDLWSTRVYLRTDSTVELGVEVVHTLSAAIPQEDQTPENNIDTDPGVVLGSFDPNDKRVSPLELSSAQLLAGQEVEYTIRFQNTGTFPASRVVITDTLSSDLRHRSLRFQSSSHQCTWYTAHGILYVIFDPIFLPDSVSNEPESHGYVRFAVKPSAQLPPGSSVENSANIYFDFNVAVITEPAVFTVQLPTTVQGADHMIIRAFPDPFTHHLTLQFPMPLTPQHQLELIDIHGRVVRTVGGSKADHIILHRHGLASGSYLARLSHQGKPLASIRVIAE